MNTHARQCPYCDAKTRAVYCEIHGVPTLDGTLLAKPPVKVVAGMTVAGRYRVDRALGAGGFGAVFVATQLAMGRPVALKIIRPDRSANMGTLRRFYREAQAISRLSHPNVVQIFDFGIDEVVGAPFIVFELVSGYTLNDLLKRSGPQSEVASARIIAQVARGLAVAHAENIVHRDLKPSNVMVAEVGRQALVKILDFGVAKVVDSAGGALTVPGSVIGTPAYLSPEQAIGGAVDFRSDLYALGCTLHKLLTGTPPFSGKELNELVRQHVSSSVPSLPDRLADGKAPSAALIAMHRALLEKEPIKRPTSTEAVAEIFDAIAVGAPVEAGALLKRAQHYPISGSVEPLRARSESEMRELHDATLDSSTGSDTRELSTSLATLFASRPWLWAASATTAALFVVVLALVITRKGATLAIDPELPAPAVEPARPRVNAGIDAGMLDAEILDVDVLEELPQKPKVDPPKQSEKAQKLSTARDAGLIVAEAVPKIARKTERLEALAQSLHGDDWREAAAAIGAEAVELYKKLPSVKRQHIATYVDRVSLLAEVKDDKFDREALAKATAELIQKIDEP